MQVEQPSIADRFELVERSTGKVWMNKTKPAWIVFYSAVRGVRAAYFQAYRAVEPVPQGRAPWSVNNKRLGHVDYGFPTLEAAMGAAS